MKMSTFRGSHSNALQNLENMLSASSTFCGDPQLRRQMMCPPGTSSQLGRQRKPLKISFEASSLTGEILTMAVAEQRKTKHNPAKFKPRGIKVSLRKNNRLRSNQPSGYKPERLIRPRNEENIDQALKKVERISLEKTKESVPNAEDNKKVKETNIVEDLENLNIEVVKEREESKKQERLRIAMQEEETQLLQKEEQELEEDIVSKKDIVAMNRRLKKSRKTKKSLVPLKAGGAHSVPKAVAMKLTVEKKKMKRAARGPKGGKTVGAKKTKQPKKTKQAAMEVVKEEEETEEDENEEGNAAGAEAEESKDTQRARLTEEKKACRVNQSWALKVDSVLMGRENEALEDADFSKLVKQLGLLPKWRPMTAFLVKGPLECSRKDLDRLLEIREDIFNMRVDRARARLDFLKDQGLTDQEVKKLVVAHPRVLEYRIERTLRARIKFLREEVKVSSDQVPRVLVRAPGLLSLSLTSLRARIRFLKKEVGIDDGSIGQVITRHPGILTLSLEETMRPRLAFFESLGVSHEGCRKMVTRHPQVLQYKIESMVPRLKYLQSIGMTEDEIVTTISRLSQVFSLSVENSLRPKFEYLVNELGGSVSTVTTYPAYFSLSLEKRIKPRHRFLVALGKAPHPFPMKMLSINDNDFVTKYCRCPLQDFENFRAREMLQDFQEKHQTHV